MNHDDLHLDIELQLQDVLARLQRRLARRDEHVPNNPEPLQLVDHLAELCAPCEHAQLEKEWGSAPVSHAGQVRGGEIEAHAHLSVLFIASVQHVGSRLEGNVAYRILLDDIGRGLVGYARRGGRLGRLHIRVSN